MPSGGLHPIIKPRMVVPICEMSKTASASFFENIGREISMTRFPPPWTAKETEACFIVKAQNGQTLAYVYFENEPGRRTAANLLTRDEARRMASSGRQVT